MSTKPIILALVIGLSASYLSADQVSKRITVTGRSIGTTPAAEEEAKLDALREAVKRVCGSFINAQTEVQDFAVVRDKILEQPVGFARVVKVIKGPEIIDGEITQVQLEAEVFPAEFERRWAEFAHIKQREGNPRCVIVIVEDDDPRDSIPPITNGIVQTELENFFLSKDIQLMDKQVSDAVRERDLQLAAAKGDLVKAAAAGAAFKADLVVVGQAQATPAPPVTIGEHTLRNWNVTLNVRVVQTDSSAILVSGNYTPEKRYMSTTGSGKDGLAAMAKDVAPKVLSDIGEAWRKRATVGKIIQVTFQPCSRTRFKAIQAVMLQSKGVIGGNDGFALRELANDIATADVHWRYNLSQLADRLEELSITYDNQQHTFEVTEQSANRITVRVKTKRARSPATRPVTSKSQPA